MLDDTEQREEQEKPAPETPPGPTTESLQRDLEQARRYSSLIRQQRDNAVRLANDLQVDLADCQYQLAQANERIAELHSS